MQYNTNKHAFNSQMKRNFFFLQCDSESQVSNFLYPTAPMNREPSFQPKKIRGKNQSFFNCYTVLMVYYGSGEPILKPCKLLW